MKKINVLYLTAAFALFNQNYGLKSAFWDEENSYNDEMENVADEDNVLGGSEEKQNNFDSQDYNDYSSQDYPTNSEYMDNQANSEYMDNQDSQYQFDNQQQLMDEQVDKDDDFANLYDENMNFDNDQDVSNEGMSTLSSSDLSDSSSSDDNFYEDSPLMSDYQDQNQDDLSLQNVEEGQMMEDDRESEIEMADTPNPFEEQIPDDYSSEMNPDEDFGEINY